MKRTPHVAVFLAFGLAAVILFGFTLVPHFGESVKEMQRFTHTSTGFAILMGIVLVFAIVAKFIFVDLWSWREARRRKRQSLS